MSSKEPPKSSQFVPHRATGSPSQRSRALRVRVRRRTLHRSHGTKKIVAGKSQLLNGGRTHFLELTRNMGFPTLTLSFVIFLVMHWDLATTHDWFGPVFTISLFMVVWLLSFYASFSLFYERCFAEFQDWLKQQKALIHKRISCKRERREELASQVIRHRKVQVFELVASSLVALVIFMMVAVAAWQGASHLPSAKSVAATPGPSATSR